MLAKSGAELPSERTVRRAGRFVLADNSGVTELRVGEARAQLCRATQFASLA